MCALRMEAPVVAGVVGVKPESSLGFRLKFDEAGLVVSAVHSPHVMLWDIEALENCVLRRAALCHDDIWTQES